MPIPEPKPKEEQRAYIGRCMSFLVGDEGLDKRQASAICYSKWRKYAEKD